MPTLEGTSGANKENRHNVATPKDTVVSSVKKTTADGQEAANAAGGRETANAAGGQGAANAAGGREAANALFKKGQIAEARAAFMSLVNNETDQAELAALHNNLSACCKHLGDQEGAITHAQECLERDPVHAKSHFRLAQLCIGKEQNASGHNEVDARKHLMTAAALLGQRHCDIIPLFEKAKEGNVTVVKAKTVFDMKRAFDLVRPQKELIIVLLPGTYYWTDSDFVVLVSGTGAKVWMLGLGHVLFLKGPNQMVYVVDSASGCVENITVHGAVEDSMMACFSCANASFRLKDCRFRDHVGLTVTNNSLAFIDRCHFENMAVQGAEVRSGGSLWVTRCRFQQGVRGIIATGGAQLLHVEDTVFEGCEKEAMVFMGELMNTFVRQSDAERRARDRQEVQQKISASKKHRDNLLAMLDANEAASIMAIETGTAGLLSVRVERCHFRLNKTRALACTNGARAELLGCLFERTDDTVEAKRLCVVEMTKMLCQSQGMSHPSRAVMNNLAREYGIDKTSAVAVFISGGASVRIAYCAFSANHTAVNIDYNFDGCVHLEKCTFYANNNDVVESVKPNRAHGIWSKPAVIHEKRTLTNADEVPTMESLRTAVDTFETMPPIQPYAAPSLSAVSGNPARWCSFMQTDPHYYPIGNTFGFDVLQHCAPYHTHTAVFLACGDIRNVAETLAGWWDRHAEDNAHVELTMNDASVSILARNVVLLELFARDVAPAIVRNVWGAATWDAATYRVFKDALAHAREPWLECDADIEAVMRAWANVTLRPKHVVEAMPYFTQARTEIMDLTCLAVGKTHRKEVEKYLSTLSFDAGSTMHANPTLLDGEGLKPSMYPTSSLFRAVGPLHAPRNMLGSALLRCIASYVHRCGAALRSGRVHIHVVHGDAFDFPRRPRADAVEMSNLADYTGFANVLLLGARCGNRIFAQSMHRKYELAVITAQEQFFVDCFGISSAAFSDLVGLERTRADVCSCGILWTEWVRAPRSTHAVPRALNAAKVAKHMCAPIQKYKPGGVSANTSVTCAALVGPRICQATAPPIAHAECSLMTDACARTLRVPCANMDYFTARLNSAGTFAVAITAFSPAVGDVLPTKNIQSLFHVVRFHDVGACVDVLVPAEFPRTGYATFVQCNTDIVCLAEPKEVEQLSDVGPAPATLRALSCYAEEYYPFTDGRDMEWRLVARRKVEEYGQPVEEVDVAFPPGTRGVDVVAEGATLVFTVGGAQVFTVAGNAPFEARKRALSSPKLGLLTCAFVVGISRVLTR
eukprot:GEMP01004128.1.p1 GENE.GEMP01004128.1~~GEMP01004128.1.p1  ORF type:complete len:1266 (-),score=264.43 GEMP01004128.1:461-4258(-)